MAMVCVVADDLTGAAETGGIALQYGLKASIVLSPEMANHYSGDVIIVDTNSRGMAPEEAAGRITELARHIDFSRFDLVYKKVDSVLRGPVFSEISTLAGILQVNTVLLISANPSRRRTIRNGKYYIDNRPLSETDFRFDPRYPRISEDVKEMISDYSPLTYNGDVIIPDIGSEEDIRLHALLSGKKEVLCAGGADFFRSLLENRMKLSLMEYERDLQIPDNHYFIIGSVAETRQKTITALKRNGFPVHYMPLPVLERREEFDRWIKKITGDSMEFNKLVVTGPESRIQDEAKILAIAGSLVSAAKVIIRNAPVPGLLFLEGGDTASLFFRTMEWKELAVLQVLADGIVVLGAGDSGWRFVVKPGSYVWPVSVLNN